MKQLVLPAVLSDGQRITLSRGDSHYLGHVLRVKTGEQLTVVDGNGQKHIVEVASVTADAVTLQHLVPLDDGIEATHIRVYQAIPKGRRFDDIVRNLTQLGVREITPIVTERSVADPTDKIDAKTERWNRVAKEAVQQSGAPPVTVHTPRRLRDLDVDTSDLSLVLHPEPLENEPLHVYLVKAPNEISLWVGPEGGFADNEVQWLRERGAVPLWLGPRVFRSELAAVVAASSIQTILLEQSAWRPTTEQES